jgi:hypothetical protein
MVGQFSVPLLNGVPYLVRHGQAMLCTAISQFGVIKSSRWLVPTNATIEDGQRESPLQVTFPVWDDGVRRTIEVKAMGIFGGVHPGVDSKGAALPSPKHRGRTQCNQIPGETRWT